MVGRTPRSTFFVHRSLPHRDLNYFPTRRSSDLSREKMQNVRGDSSVVNREVGHASVLQSRRPRVLDAAYWFARRAWARKYKRTLRTSLLLPLLENVASQSAQRQRLS